MKKTSKNTMVSQLDRNIPRELTVGLLGNVDKKITNEIF